MKNSYVTDENLKNVNKDSVELGEEFIEYLSSIGRSKETISQYKNDLKILWVLLLENCKNKFFVEITKRDIIKIQNFLLNIQKLSPARIRRFRSTMSSLSNYIANILDEDYPSFRNQISKIEAPTNTPVREIDYFDFEFAKKVAYELINDGKIQPAFYLMLATACGARKAELLRLKMSDLEEDKLMLGTLYKSEKIKTKGKGDNMLNKYTIKSLIDDFIPIFKEYRELIGVNIDYIFFRKQGNEFKPAIISTANSYSDTINTYFKNKHYHSHSSRHTYVTELLKQGLPIEVVREIVGHKSSQVTEMYDERDTSDILSKYFKDGKIIGNKEKNLGEI